MQPIPFSCFTSPRLADILLQTSPTAAKLDLRLLETEHATAAKQPCTEHSKVTESSCWKGMIQTPPIGQNSEFKPSIAATQLVGKRAVLVAASHIELSHVYSRTSAIYGRHLLS